MLSKGENDCDIRAGQSVGKKDKNDCDVRECQSVGKRGRIIMTSEPEIMGFLGNSNISFYFYSNFVLPDICIRC